MKGEDLENRLELIEKKLDKLIFLTETEVKPECKKMGGHIDFVEKVYENVKHPLNTVCNLFTSKKPSLPQTDFQIEYLE